MTLRDVSPAHLYSFSQCLLSIITPSHPSPTSLAERKIPGHAGMKAPHKSGSKLNIQRHQEQVQAITREKGRCAPCPGVCSCLDPWDHQWESPRGRQDPAGLTESHSEEKPCKKQLQLFPNDPSLTCHKACCLVCRIQSDIRQDNKQKSLCWPRLKKTSAHVGSRGKLHPT